MMLLKLFKNNRNNNFNKTVLKLLIISISFFLLNQTSYAQTFCIDETSDQIVGVQDGYRYELWNQNSTGNACMTLGEGALFNGEWSGIFNYLARRGLGYNQTKKHQQIGTFYSKYNCDYNPASGFLGNSYLSIYGWTVNPLIEYYIIEDWRNWIPSMADGATFKGTISINGSIYDIYENTRVNKPSIVGTATFQQYFSIRRDRRTDGTINISEHFKKWEELGMDMGYMHEVSFVVEGFLSNGSFEFTELDVFISDATTFIEVENSDEKLLNIYPNPSSGNINIELNNSSSNTHIRIYNVLGHIVFSKETANQNSYKISNLKSGIYFVHVHNQKQNYYTKFVVN